MLSHHDYTCDFAIKMYRLFIWWQLYEFIAGNDVY